MPRSCANRCLFPLALLTACALAAPGVGAEVPPPAQTPCQVVVHGRTSTLKSIVIKNVGRNVPLVYHGEHRAGNTPGFSWFVSEHYALKTDLGDEQARHFLTLSELAYPHYVAIIGREPPGISTTRMAFIEAKNYKRMQEAVVSDLGTRWAGNGGGVTLPADWVAYNYPSGGLRYHLNDLCMHENLHLLHCCVQRGFRMPLRFVEGITHSMANHVYDPARHRLTVAVFDKAPINNPVDAALRCMREKGVFALGDLVRREKPGDYPLPEVMWTYFCWSSPRRLMQWRLWRDELLAARLTGKLQKDLDIDLVERIFGGVEKLEGAWKAWLARRHNTFTHVDWGWEQWGGTLQSYGWPWKKNLYSQMDINYAPGKRLSHDPLRLDYPQPAPTPLVARSHFGGDAPSVGVVVDFSLAANRGWAGLGLGVQGRSLLRVVVQENRRLVVDGTRLGLQAGRKDFPFAGDFLAAAQGAKKVGVTATIAKDALRVELRAPAPDAGKAPLTMRAAYPLQEGERWNLVTRHLALISRDAKHLLTPVLDAQLPSRQDYTVAVAPNRWGYAADRETYRLYRCAWLLHQAAPRELLALRDLMLTAMDQDRRRQAEAMRTYRKRIAGVLTAITACKHEERLRCLGIMAGVRVDLRIAPDGPAVNPGLTAYVKNDGGDRLEGSVKLAGVGEVPAKRFTVAPGQEQALRWPGALFKDVTGPVRCLATAAFSWQGHRAQAQGAFTLRPGIPCYLLAGPFDNHGDGTVDRKQAVESEVFAREQTFAGYRGKRVAWKRVARPDALPVDREFVVDLAKRFGDMKNVSAYATTWVIAPRAMDVYLACGSDDGIVVWVNGERVHTRLANRGYTSRSDVQLVHLRRGTNRVLARITQTWGGWRFALEFLDRRGRVVPGLRYADKP